MNENTISPTDAGLLIHRFVTEDIPVLAWFVSAHSLLKVKLVGFVNGFTREMGLAISTESPRLKPDTALPGYLTLSHDLIAASVFRYSDESELPADFEFKSGLRIDLPNGDTLTIIERRREN